MVEWLNKQFKQLSDLRLEELHTNDWWPLLMVLLISCAASILLSLYYSVFFERRSTGSDIHRSFPALGTGITGIFLCLQFSLPLSLGLLGALSIVRFRTPIKEPEEIGFLMLLIASSICAATLNIPLMVMILGLSLAVLTAMRFLPWCFGRRTATASLIITTPSEGFSQLLPKIMSLAKASSRGATLDAVTECDGETTATFSLYAGDAGQLTALQERVRELVGKGEVSLFLQRSVAL